MKIVRLLLMFVLLSGCATQQIKPISTENRQNIHRIAVVSKIGDALSCNFTGITVFHNAYTVYELNRSFNGEFSDQLVEGLNAKGLTASAIDENKVTFKNERERSDKWENLVFADDLFEKSNFDTLLILDGAFSYVGVGGYYARDNALTTSVKMYVYDLKNKKKIGSNMLFHKDLKREFSCSEEKIDMDDYILTIAKRRVYRSLNPLVNELFSISGESEGAGFDIQEDNYWQ